MGRDELAVRVGELRQRLFEVVLWFRHDHNRLVLAQDVRRGDQTWERRRDARSVDLLDGPVGPLQGRPEHRLLELEAVDRAAALAGARAAHPMPCRGGDGESAWVVRRAPLPPAHTTRQAGVLMAHHPHHVIVPRLVVVPGGTTYEVKLELLTAPARLERTLARREVRVATTSFEDGAALELDPDGWARTMGTAGARRDTMLEALAAAARDGVDLLVVPELTLPPDARVALQESLRRRGARSPELGLAVLGSFHEPREVDGAIRIFNVAALVDGNGNTVLEHLKLTRFGDHDAASSTPAEAIHLGAALRVLSTPIGLIAVAICKDFCDVHVGAIWQQLKPDWLLVPAYGPGASAHHAAAGRLSLAAGTVTVVAHESHGSCRDANSSFVFDRRVVTIRAYAPEIATHNVTLSFEIDGDDGGD